MDADPETQMNRSKSLTVPISVLNHSFEFKLETRPLTLDTGVKVQYYWMDSSFFRRFKSEDSFTTFQTVVGHWGTAMRATGVGGEIDQQIQYVTAICYPLIAEAKSLRDVYKDAYLKPKTTNPTADSVPDDVRKRIRRVVRERDVTLLRTEFDRALGRFTPRGALTPLLQEAFRRWVGRGVTELRRAGNDGLELFLREIDAWIGQYRKKGGNVWVRHFVNLFCYECKVSFFTCYANVWVDLIPWLRENHGLDAVSERFLRFWHHQNDNLGGVEGRDVFNGQVLALHPLSGFFMKDPALMALAGRFFGSTAYNRVFQQGKVASSAAYWELVGAILTAAYLYRGALDRQKRNRGTRAASSLEVHDEQSVEEVGDELTLLREFLSGQGLSCPHCGGKVEPHAVIPIAEGAETFDTQLTCRRCRHSVTHQVATEELLSWLRKGE